MYYFIVNPNSRCGKGLIVWKEVLTFIQKNAPELDYEVYMTAKGGDAREFSRQLTEKSRENMVITVIGGDGTLNEVVDGTCLNCDNISISYIPSGTGNDFARSLKMHQNVKRHLRQLAQRKVDTLIDYGVLSCQSGNRRFVVSAGIGYDAAVCHALLKSSLKARRGQLRIGKLTYLVNGLKQIVLARQTRGYVVLDGEKRHEFNNLLFVSAHVHPYEGGGFKLAPYADYNDGKLDLCVVSCKNRFRLIGIMLSALFGHHAHMAGVHLYQCSSAEIHTERELPVHTDGESCGFQTDLVLHCVRRRLKIRA